jgi:nucleotide-binding universal stress UspA family protein
MIELRRILCPIDFSDASRRALDHAVAIAKWYGSDITLLHVSALAPVAPIAPYPGSMPPELIGLTQVDKDRLFSDLEAFAEREKAAGVRVTPALREGSAASEILEAAERLPADLLVMGTHGRTGFDRWLLGSVTEKVLRKARCPVLSVPPHAPDAVPLPVFFKKIVCPVDFSTSSMTALTYALSLAQQADAELIVLHVIELPPDIHGVGPLDLAEYRRVYEEESRRRLSEAVPAEARTYCTVREAIVTGKPYREILRVADDQQSELIVMGVQGRGAADLLFFGSTTQHVVRQATCPVLTLRQKVA